MNGSKSPVAASAPAETTEQKDVDSVATNGHQSPQPGHKSLEPKALNGSPKRSIEEEVERQDEDNELPDAPPPATNGDSTSAPDGEEDANSEAETVLTSPVKKREAERRVATIKQEKSEQSKISAQPVLDEDDEDDDEADAPGSPDDSAIPAPSIAPSRGASPPRRNEDAKKDEDQNSESLSDVSPTRSAASGQSSRASSKSRARSEHPESRRKNKESPNPKKRKHRASSVNLPNKRPSIDVAKRRLRDLHSEGAGGNGATARSPSPSRKVHRRAASTQSVLLDGTSEAPGNRKRRAASQFPVSEAKAMKATWDESSVSSETTSHGHGDAPTRRRGIGRSTSTPGRPTGRELKRHINKYGFTKLAEACEDGDLDLVKEWRDKDPDQLEIEEFAKNTPLQIASLNGNSEVVEYLIDQGCRVDCANVDKDTPLIDAAENGHLDVVDILLNAGVDPLRQNLKGQQALDVVGDDTENATAIRASLRRAMERWNSVDARKRREHEEEQRFGGGPSEALHFMARTYENLHKLVVNNDRNSVREFLDARVPVDNNIIAAAARTGDSYLINMLLAEMTDKKAFQKPEKPLLAVLGTSHLETVKSLTELDQFNPLWCNRQGKTWPEIADERHGPMWVQESELLHRLYNEARSKIERRSSSPVTKRDEVKRRPPPQSGDNSGEENSPPKRKNGKRLMSRREMRAASGKPFGDSSSEDSSSETAREAEDSMKPPESPAEKRGSVRPRTKSASAQPSGSSQEAARTRRRSSSLRGKVETSLPIVDETMEDADSVVVGNHAVDAEQVKKATVIVPASEAADANSTVRKEWDEAATREAAESQKREEEAKRKEEDAKTREAEEKARQAEAEERAEKQRMAEAEEARSRQDEEDKVAEAARKAEEHRQRLEAELSEARSRHRQALASSLPDALSRILSPSLDSSIEQNRLTNEVLEVFTPLQALPGMNSSVTEPSYKSRGELLVLNAQAAPLLGKIGLDLLLQSNAPGYDQSLGREWAMVPLTGEEKECARSILPGYLLSKNPLVEDSPSIDDDLSLEEELTRTARRIKKAQEAQAQFDSADIELRWIRLQDVLDHLHPALRDVSIDVRTDFCRPRERAQMLKHVRARGETSFFDGVLDSWRREALPTKLEVGTTEVKVVHEK